MEVLQVTVNMKVDINADLGEGFGRWSLDNFEEVMKYVTSANIATGFHAGDPEIMERAILCAKENNVGIGAHLGLPDKRGFGRRQMNISVNEMRTDTLYQFGAMDAFLKIHGAQMQHVKPHGILYRMVYEFEQYTEAFLDTVKAYNPDLFVVCPANFRAYEMGRGKGLKMVAEGLPDLSYDTNGNWVLERRKAPRTPQEVADRALSFAKDSRIQTVDGKWFEIKADTVCIHGDAPNAVDVAKTVKETLEKNGFTVCNYFEMFK
jgi:UPF0271 protein